MTRPIRVLTLIDAFRMGGAETLLAPLAVAARDSGVVMDFVGVSPEAINADKTMAILHDAGIETRSLGIKRLLDPVAIPRLVREIRNYDVVHAHLEMAMTLAVPAAAIARRPAVCTFHHVALPLSGRAAKRERLAVAAASRSDRAIFVTEASRESFQQVYRPKGLPRNWDVVHNGIDTANFVPGMPDARVRSELGGGTGPLVVLPAAFRAFKGIPVAIAAWSAVRQEFPDAILSLVGGGELEPDLREQVRAAGLEDAIVFAGVRTDMPAVYRAADVVLLPSTHGENLPTVLIEASATERPLAASRVGGVPDIVADKTTGLLFDPHDPTALAGAVKELLGNSGLRESLGRAATERVDREFSARAWIGKLERLYREAVEGRQ